MQLRTQQGIRPRAGSPPAGSRHHALYRGLPPESLVVGGVAQVSQAFADLGDLGYSHVLVRHLADDQGEVLASYERLGTVRSHLADL